MLLHICSKPLVPNKKAPSLALLWVFLDRAIGHGTSKPFVYQQPQGRAHACLTTANSGMLSSSASYTHTELHETAACPPLPLQVFLGHPGQVGSIAEMFHDVTKPPGALACTQAVPYGHVLLAYKSSLHGFPCMENT